MAGDIEIRRFHAADQDAARALILQGMEEHLGWLDHTLNRDLDDIAASYGYGIFLVACHNEELVGTGALVPQENSVGRIVRMSVAKRARRQGVGKLLLDRLCEEARQCGYHRLAVGTEAHWSDAVSFYLSYGFETTSCSADGHKFAMDIA